MAGKTGDKQGAAAFERTYAALFGPRWPALRAALVEPAAPVPLSDGLLQPYWLDAASVRAARALQVAPGHRVLDLCAAPGGKTLVLALALDGEGLLVSNDRSPERRRRLRAVLDQHLPPRLRSTVTVTGHDGSRWGLREPQGYDRVLLDAPCSSERHVLASPPHLALWSPARPRNLAHQGLALLCAAFDALRPGGLLVYSTCAVNPAENEAVVESLGRKRPGGFEVVEQVGVQPDRDAGEGPLYWAVLRRTL